MILYVQAGAFRVMCRHVQLKDNTWYYRRRVPDDVKSLHRDPVTKKLQTQLFFSLKTQDKTEACQRADAHTRRLDAHWKAHREGGGPVADPLVSVATLNAAGLKQGDGILHPDNPITTEFVDRLVGLREPHEPAQRLSAQDRMTVEILYGAPIPRTLTDAREKHFSLGKGPKGKVAEQQFERAWKLLLDIAGDITIENLRRSHANEFVERLSKQGVGAETTKRYLSQVRPVINTALREFEIAANNPFDSLTIPNAGEAPRKPRDTFSMAELEAIQKRCRETNDQRRWAIAMLSDTMTRLAEVAGLSKEDVRLEGPVPHIVLRSTAIRRLKTKQSERKVPLIGEALWAAQRASMTPGPLLFPAFAPTTPGTEFNANTASATLNKWLRENGLARDGQTLHSFRHTMRDRLRDVEAPSDLIDRIGGWKGQGVGESYGKGHSLEAMQRYMLLTVRDVGDLGEPIHPPALDRVLPWT